MHLRFYIFILNLNSIKNIIDNFLQLEKLIQMLEENRKILLKHVFFFFFAFILIFTENNDIIYLNLKVTQSVIQTKLTLIHDLSSYYFQSLRWKIFEIIFETQLIQRNETLTTSFAINIPASDPHLRKVRKLMLL